MYTLMWTLYVGLALMASTMIYVSVSFFGWPNRWKDEFYGWNKLIFSATVAILGITVPVLCTIYHCPQYALCGLLLYVVLVTTYNLIMGIRYYSPTMEAFKELSKYEH